jgi:hypothetical protein
MAAVDASSKMWQRSALPDAGGHVRELMAAVDASSKMWQRSALPDAGGHVRELMAALDATARWRGSALRIGAGQTSYPAATLYRSSFVRDDLSRTLRELHASVGLIGSVRDAFVNHDLTAGFRRTLASLGPSDDWTRQVAAAASETLSLGLASAGLVELDRNLERELEAISGIVAAVGSTDSLDDPAIATRFEVAAALGSVLSPEARSLVAAYMGTLSFVVMVYLYVANEAVAKLALDGLAVTTISVGVIDMTRRLLEGRKKD